MSVRDAGSGHFTTPEDAEARPGETVTETASHPSRRELAGAIRVLETAAGRELGRDHVYATQAGERQGLQERLEDLTQAIAAALELLR
jgi:hypothetical protein